MDQDLIAYFERKFDEAREQQRAELSAFRQEVNGRFGQIDGRFGQIDGRFEQIDGRFKRLEDDVRQAHVSIEDVRDQIRLVAEGVTNVDEKLERFREEQAKEHAETRALLKRSYSALDERVTRIEKKRAAGSRAR